MSYYIKDVLDLPRGDVDIEQLCKNTVILIETYSFLKMSTKFKLKYLSSRQDLYC